MTVPWMQLLVALAGVILMALPGVTGARGAGADALHVLGPLIATIGVMAMAGVLRVCRWANVLLGAAVVVSPFAFRVPQSAAVVAIGAGLAVIFASARDHPDPHFRGRWRALFAPERR
jgi:hypothetical protein